MPKRASSPDLLLDGAIRALEGVLNDLKSIGRPEPKAPKTKPPSPLGTHIREAIEIFNTMYATRFGGFPYLTTPDKMALARLHKDLPDFREILMAYLDCNDPWVTKNGYAARLIPGQVEGLRRAMAPKVPDILAKEWK